MMILTVLFGIALLQLNSLHQVFGLVNINTNTNTNWRSNDRSLFAVPSLNVATSTAIYDNDVEAAAVARASEADKFHLDLVKAGLSLCHGEFVFL